MMEKREKESVGGAVVASPAALVGSRDDNEMDASMRTAEILLRLVLMALCLSALIVMVKNSQSNTDFGSLSYSDLGAFRYLVHANGICAGYSLLSAVIVAIPRPSISRAWTFFFLDQILTYLILAAGAASTEVLYLAYEGDVSITWSAACGSFGRFCHRATASVIITFVVVVCYGVLSLLSSYRLFSNFDPPVGYTTKGIEDTVVHG
ncbi:hypothetical protein SLA2020_371810 [Shorea laevis]